MKILLVILLTLAACGYPTLAGYFIVAPLLGRRSKPEFSLMMGTALVFSVLVFSGLLLFLLSLPLKLALFIPLFIVLGILLVKPQALFVAARCFPLRTLLIYLALTLVMVFNCAGYPLLDNAMRLVDWTLYYNDAVRFHTGSPLVDSYMNFKDLAQGISNRPMFYQIYTAIWFGWAGSGFWIFQLLTVALNTLFFLPVMQLIKAYVPSRYQSLILLFLFLNPEFAYQVSGLYPKHITYFLVLTAALVLEEAQKLKPFIWAGAWIFVTAYYTHQSALFYLPLLVFVLGRKRHCRADLLHFAGALAAFGAAPLFYKVHYHGWVLALTGSPIATTQLVNGPAQHLVKWAFNLGSCFLPMYPIYGFFFDNNVLPSLPAKLLHTWLLLPHHIADSWYWVADGAGFVFIPLLAWTHRKKFSKLAWHTQQVFRQEPLFQWVSLSILGVIFGYFFIDNFIYGGNISVGRLAVTLTALWLWTKFSSTPYFDRWKYPLLALSALENLLLVWLVLPAMAFAVSHKDSLFYQVFFPFNDMGEDALRPGLTYLFDLFGGSTWIPLLLGWLLQGLLAIALLRGRTLSAKPIKVLQD